MDLHMSVANAKDYLVKLGYNVAFIGIYGSQNYGLDIYTEDYQSDVDFKAVIIPSLDDLVFDSKPLSTTLEYKGGQIDIKDVRIFMETLVKCNPAYIEVLYTDFAYSSDDFSKIINLREDLVSEMGEFLLRASYGMIMEKVKAFSHPYPTIKDKIDKYGYDPKQLHHIMRLYHLMKKYVRTGKFDMSNKEQTLHYLKQVKTGKFSLHDAEVMRDLYDKDAKQLKEEYKTEPRFETKNKIINLSRELVKNSIQDQWTKCPVCKSEFSRFPGM